MLHFLIRCAFLLVLGLPAFASGAGGVILQYHHVASTTPAITSISVENFQRHLDYLGKNNFHIWHLEKLITALNEGTEIPDKVASITFDDAYVDIYDNALPILKKKKYPFTIFVATQLIGRTHYLSWNQLKEMQMSGATIANHTHSHTHLLRTLENENKLDWQSRIEYEISHAQDLIVHHLGETPKLLAYPYGEFNDDILKIAGSLGYFGLGQQSGAAGTGSSLLALPRYPLSGYYSDIGTFRTKMMTLPMPLRYFASNPILDPSTVRPQLTLRFDEGKYRFDELVCYGPGGATQLDRQGESIFVATNIAPVPVGRSRYNCTMPANGSNRYYWFSQMWIRKNPDGSWYTEP